MSNPLHLRMQAACLRFADELFEIISQRAAADEWVDQYVSPLGKRRHLAAVRLGKLPGVKDGKRVLVRRSDIEAYMKLRAIAPRETDDHDLDVHGYVAELGAPRRKNG